MSQQLSTNTFGTAKFIVSNSAALGTHTTIQSAIDDAVAGETVFIRPKTDVTAYSENLTLKAGVNLSAYLCDALTPNVTISGKASFTEAGTVSISGIRLASNGAEFLSVTGSAASIVNLTNCFLTTAFDPGITFSSSHAGASININYCIGDISASAKKYFSHSSAGSLNFNYSVITDSGASTTASTCSSGNIVFRSSSINFPITTSSTGVITGNFTSFNTSSLNTTALTCGGSAGNIIASEFTCGTASSISIGGTLTLINCIIASSNTNAITGEGTLNYSGIFFSSTSSKINTTTQTGGLIQGGVTQAPSVGFIGERLTSAVTNVATTSTTAKTITFISLTAGIWDVSAIATSVATGGTAIMTVQQVNISTTDNTIVGNIGDAVFQTNTVAAGASVLSGCVPSFRVVVTSTTIYYLVVVNIYTSTTCPTSGRISATRVG